MSLIAAAPPAYGPGLLGFLVVAAIGGALFFLIKSMNRQISKIEVPSEDEQRRAAEQDKEQAQ
ncbi:hypothetical protein J5X84_40060 [Streptosporangiaceae bacterium NEAU-GS5]|nr:hypothetical protein [Streptosporangiaceae bacterium NEAU-GS5]